MTQVAADGAETVTCRNCFSNAKRMFYINVGGTAGRFLSLISGAFFVFRTAINGGVYVYTCKTMAFFK